VLIGCLYDPFRCFSALNAKQLFKASSLGVVRCLFKFVLPLLLVKRLLLEHLHQFHVQLITLVCDDLLHFAARCLTSWAYKVGCLKWLCTFKHLRHRQRLFDSLFGRSYIHKSTCFLAISLCLRCFNLLSVLIRQIYKRLMLGLEP